MKTYCVREKRKTECVPGSEELVMMRNGREGVKCICASCGAKKISIVSKMAIEPETRKKKLAADILLGKIPKDHAKFRELYRKPQDQWQKILADDRYWKKRRAMDMNIDYSGYSADDRFRNLQEEREYLDRDLNWQLILDDDAMMKAAERQRNKSRSNPWRLSPDERFANLMKAYEIGEQTRKAMKRSVGPAHTKKQMAEIARRNRIERAEKKQKKF